MPLKVQIFRQRLLIKHYGKDITIFVMKYAVGSVVYKEAEAYLLDFLESIEKQTDNDFNVFLLNDNYNLEELETVILEYRLKWKKRLYLIDCSKQKLKPYELRIKLLQEAKKHKIDILLLGDCDDVMSNDRMASVKKNDDKQIAFFYNELKGYEEQNVLPELPDAIYDFRDIGEYNFLGLTNTAINMNWCTDAFIESLREGSLRVFDWYLFTRILLSGGYGKEVEGCYTYYRIHDANIAGRTYGQEKLRTEIEVKKKHYAILQHYNSYYVELYKLYCEINPDEIDNTDWNQCVFWWGMICLKREEDK